MIQFLSGIGTLGLPDEAVWKLLGRWVLSHREGMRTYEIDEEAVLSGAKVYTFGPRPDARLLFPGKPGMGVARDVQELQLSVTKSTFSFSARPAGNHGPALLRTYPIRWGSRKEGIRSIISGFPMGNTRMDEAYRVANDYLQECLFAGLFEVSDGSLEIQRDEEQCRFASPEEDPPSSDDDVIFRLIRAAESGETRASLALYLDGRRAMDPEFAVPSVWQWYKYSKRMRIDCPECGRVTSVPLMDPTVCSCPCGQELDREVLRAWEFCRLLEGGEGSG